MSKKTLLTAEYDSLPLLLRIIIQIFIGVFISGIWRIARYFETKSKATLLVGLLATFTGIGNVIAWIIDLVSLILNGKFTLFIK